MLLAATLSLCLAGCAARSSDPAVPVWPVAGPAVAAELERACAPQVACPALWDWIARLDVLKRQLDIARDRRRDSSKHD